jgi:hypothetical protein
MAEMKAAFPQGGIEWSEPNRTAAEAILALGGAIHVRRQDQAEDQQVSVASDLPNEYFRVTRASLAGIRQPLSGPLARVAALTDPQFDGLESLDLTGSAVTDADLAGLERLTALRRLVLDGTGVRVPTLIHLKGLTHLKELRLGCPGISDLAAGFLMELKGLEQLSLAGSGLTDAGVEKLKTLSGLQKLDLTGAPVSPAAVAGLQKALPGCHIVATPVPAK